ncbi:MAG: hypothetical protein WA183_06835 [Chthoniobacterales bacterium]
MTLEHGEAQGMAVSPWRAVAFGEGWQSAGAIWSSPFLGASRCDVRVLVA